MSMSQKVAEKNLENWILAKDNNSRKSWSSVTKLQLDLYHVMTNSYTKFQVNISKDDREKSITSVHLKTYKPSPKIVADSYMHQKNT